MVRLNDAIDDYGRWRLTQGGASLNTWKGEKPGLYGFSFFLDDPEVAAVDTNMVGRWWDEWVGTLADSTRATRLHQLRSFFDWSVKMGYRDTDPTQMIRAPKVAAEPRERLTADELLGLLQHTRTPRDRALLALAMNLGLRGGEIQRLRWRDVNWSDETIRVEVDKTSEIDVMPISSDLMRELAHWASQIPTAYTRNIMYGFFVIPSQHLAPSGALTYRWTMPITAPYEVVKYALTQAGWDDVKQEGVHTIRRSVARIYFDKVEAEESFDSALLATMTLLHHTRPDTTLAYIGRDRATMARDRILKGQPFLSALRKPTALRVVAS